MGGISQLVGQLLSRMGVSLSGPQLVLVLAVVSALMLPGFVRNARVSVARSHLARARLLSGPERQAAEDSVLRAAGEQPAVLVAVAEEALRLGREGLARAATERLGATGKERKAYRALQRSLAPPAPKEALLEEVLVVVERLIDEGRTEEASRRLDIARQRWPEAPTVEAIQATRPA